MWHVKYFSKGMLNMPSFLLEEMLTSLRLNQIDKVITSRCRTNKLWGQGD